MAYIKWTFYAVIITVIVAFFHYSLPSRDIVRIVGTDTRIVGTGTSGWFWASEDAGTNASAQRDVRFISAVYPDNSPRVYRNEDTAWSWPPYLKFDSSNLDAIAKDFAKSNEERWVAVSHYGWRFEWLSMFPNAYKIREVEGPDVQLIPWFNIIFLTIIAMIVWAIYVRIRRFRRNRIDPVLEDIGETYDDVAENVSETGGRFSRWLDTWRSKKKR